MGFSWQKMSPAVSPVALLDYLFALECGHRLTQVGEALLDVIAPPSLQSVVVRPLFGLETNIKISI